MNFDLGKACSKIGEIEKQLSNHDLIIRSEKGRYEEAPHTKENEVTKLKNSEDHLTKELVEAESLAKQTYKVSYGNAIE